MIQKWKISEAKTKFTELLKLCKQDPQIICNRERPVGAVININLFEELMELRKKHQKPTISQLLAELEAIKKAKPLDIEIPARQNRPTPFEENTDEMAL